MPALPLPADLTKFLKQKQRLKYDAKQAIAGQVRLHTLASLRIGRVYAAAKGTRDPNRRKKGVYRIPAISLIARCKDYAPDHLLTFLPFEERFAAFDCDHAIVTVFTSATWADIASDPLPYLNAAWEPKPAVPTVRNMRWWERYAFYPDAFE